MGCLPMLLLGLVILGVTLAVSGGQCGVFIFP
jgi:hypothetical protein